METTIPTSTNTSERQVQVSHLHHRIVDHVCPGVGPFFDQFNIGLALAEVVYDQRLRSQCNFLDQFLQIVVIMQGKDRPEDFFLHHKRILPRRLHDDRTNKSALLINGPASVNDPSSMIIPQQFFNAVHMEAIDDLSIIAILLQTLIALVEKRDGLQQLRPEGFFEGLVDEDVIDTDACLSAVEEFSEEDAIDGRGYLGCLIDYHRTLPSQLQNTRDQILCSLYGNQSACLGRPSEAYHIDRQTGHCLRHFHLPFNHSEKPYINRMVRLSMYWSNSFLMTPELSGASSLGLRMTQFPAAMAAATCGMAVQIGQFHADITKATPSGQYSTAHEAHPKPAYFLSYPEEWGRSPPSSIQLRLQSSPGSRSQSGNGPACWQ